MDAAAIKQACARKRPGQLQGALLATAAYVGAGPAWAQYGGGYPTLPATIVDTRIGDLRGQLQQYLPGLLPNDTGPAFLATASLGVNGGSPTMHCASTGRAGRTSSRSSARPYRFLATRRG